MARIRSIKPEFWTDGKIRRLPADTALFFIGLWTFSDDYGYFSTDTLELSLRMPRWRSQSVFRMLCTLADHGLIRLCARLEVGLIIGWEHQRIRDRRASKWNNLEIQWDEITGNAHGSDKKALGEDRIGRDRRGEDLTPEVQAPAVAKPKLEPITKATWEAYSEAYLSRHKTEPVRNATVNSQLSQFVKRLGQEEAPHVAKFYLTHNDQFYVRNLHTIGLMLRDAEKLRTEWKTGRQMTQLGSRLAEKSSHAQDQLARIAKGEL